MSFTDVHSNVTSSHVMLLNDFVESTKYEFHQVRLMRCELIMRTHVKFNLVNKARSCTSATSPATCSGYQICQSRLTAPGHPKTHRPPRDP